MKTITLSILLFIPLFSFCQNNNLCNDIGLSLGVNYSVFNLSKSDWQKTSPKISDTLSDVNIENNTGFQFGIFFFKKIKNNLSLKTQLDLTFSSNNIIFHFRNSSKYIENYNISLLEVPINLNINPFNKIKNLSILGGIKYSIKLGYLNQNEEHKLKTTDYDCAVETGILYSFNINKIISSLELKYSYGFINITNRDSNLYNQSIDKLKKSCLLMSICFKKNN